MDVIEAVKARKSIRGFTSDPVPKEILQEILEISAWAPSANNTQPWEFVVLTGNALDKVREANLEAIDRRTQLTPGIPMPPGKWVDPYRRRQLDLGIGLFRLLGIGREDREGKIAWAKKGLRFFDAPAAILICVDESDRDTVYIFDCGSVAQTIALVALRYGLSTCMQRQTTNYPDAIRKATGLPPSKRIIMGIAIGYPNPHCPTYQLVTTREPLDTNTTWLGFD